jgi:N-carbamoyl-L-amino-acid hydrolase
MDDRAVLCGSHLDSVPQGGNFDGAAGVVAGLLCLNRIQALPFAKRRTITLVALRSEESAWFGKPCIGSSALLGRLDLTDRKLRHTVTDQPLRECMAAAGAQVNEIVLGKPLIDISHIAAYFELHIEQGPVLVEHGRPYGIVTGIRGNVRHNHIVCKGEDGHSGAVPQSLRHDAVLATADLLTRMERLCNQMLSKGADLVITSGVIHTDQLRQATTRIPGVVSFSLDIRSQNEKDLNAYCDNLSIECRAVEESRGVTFVFDEQRHSSPALMTPVLIKRLQELSTQFGSPALLLPSGAGHDAANFSMAGIPTAMIFVRNEHGSHNPKESMNIEDFLLASDLLCSALLETA